MRLAVAKSTLSTIQFNDITLRFRRFAFSTNSTSNRALRNMRSLFKLIYECKNRVAIKFILLSIKRNIIQMSGRKGRNVTH